MSVISEDELPFGDEFEEDDLAEGAEFAEVMSERSRRRFLESHPVGSPRGEAETPTDDETEIIVDNLLWDYATFLNTPADSPSYEDADAKLDASRNALRQRIHALIHQAGERFAKRPTASPYEPRKLTPPRKKLPKTRGGYDTGPSDD